MSDSPWLWVMLFCGFGTLVLLAFSPKYSARQHRLELQYHARQEIARRQVEGTPPARPTGEEGAEPPPEADDLIIGLWPLMGLFAGLFVVSAALLWRGNRPTAETQGASKRGDAP